MAMITFELPDHVEQHLAATVSDVDAAAKEAAVVELYRQGQLSHGSFAECLGLSRFEADAVLTALYAAVALLPEQQRLVFQFRYFDELPYADIAQILGTSQGGLKANYHHAVTKIKKTMVGLNLDLHSES